MDEIEAEYKHRQAALIRPASPLLSCTTLRSPLLSDATVKVAQAELQSTRSKMAVLEAKAEQCKLEMSSIKALMQSMVQTIQGMQSIMFLSMATAITTDVRESLRPSPRSVISSISGNSSSSELSGPSQSNCMVKRDKHNESRHCSHSPSSSSESDPESDLESVSQAGSSSSLGSRLSRNYEQDPRLPNITGKDTWGFGLLGLMTLPPTEGGAKKMA